MLHDRRTPRGRFNDGMQLAVVTHALALMAGNIPVVPKSQADLIAMANPSGADMVGYRAPLYDTQLYTSAATLNMAFFTNSNADKTMSNQKGNGGQFPANMYFIPTYMSFDVLADASIAAASTELGILDDINKLLNIARGTATITIGSTALPPIPLRYLHSAGGATGALAGTWTAPNAVQVGTAGVQDGGYFCYGSFIISPLQPFSVAVNFASAQTLNVGNINLVISFDGTWYLPVS